MPPVQLVEHDEMSESKAEDKASAPSSATRDKPIAIARLPSDVEEVFQPAAPLGKDSSSSHFHSHRAGQRGRLASSIASAQQLDDSLAPATGEPARRS